MVGALVRVRVVVQVLDVVVLGRLLFRGMELKWGTTGLSLGL